MNAQRPMSDLPELQPFAAPSDPLEGDPSALSTVRAVLAEAEAAQGDRAVLRRLLSRLAPARRRVALADGAVAGVHRAPAAALLAAIQAEGARLAAAAAATDRLPAYKRAERLYREPAPASPLAAAAAGTGSHRGVASLADAAAHGALDFLAPSLLPEGAADCVSPPGAAAGLPGGVWALRAAPGCYVLPAALAPGEQAYWVRRALRELCEPPNRRNIDGHVDPDASTLAKFGESTLAPALRGAPASSSTAAAAAAAAAPPLQRGLWRGYCAARAAPPSAPRAPLEDVAWATLGTQYDWTARVYHLPQDADYAAHAAARGGGGARWHAAFPADLRAWEARVAAALDAAARAAGGGGGGGEGGAGSLAARGLPMRLHAQAGIVNLYDTQRRSLPMGAHVDNMERDYSFPVVSATIGCAAVFLVGGESKEEPPVALLLRSGDVVVLSGACRLAYHGVAATLPGTCPDALFAGASGGGGSGGGSELSGGGDERAHFRSYLERHRINFNLRQVVSDGEPEQD